VGAAAGALILRPEFLLPAAPNGSKDHWAAPFDRAMEKFMEERKVPGGALAVVRNRRLVHARGYGWADREMKTPVKTESLFRLASVSKPITGVAVLKLVEDGQLDLAARPFELLGLHAQIPKDRTLDERWRQITVRQLLHHTAGWDRDKSFDPMFRPVEIAKELAVPGPAGPREVIRYMLGHPLDFNPGARYAYSNFGYCVLGRVLEQVTGLPYEKFVRENILAPIGITRMRIGASLDGRQAGGEVRYYTSDNSTAKNVFPEGPGKVPFPYGGFHLEAMDAHGGWIASVVDLARIAAALDDAHRSPLLKPASSRIMYEAPAAPVSRKADGALDDSWYGCGWMVRPTGDGRANTWHNGSLPGTSTLLVRRSDGISFAALFNQRSDRDGAIDPMLNTAANEVKDWPTEEAAHETR
jgi:N-acyl-D-amino-acid deacylase